MFSAHALQLGTDGPTQTRMMSIANRFAWQESVSIKCGRKSSILLEFILKDENILNQLYWILNLPILHRFFFFGSVPLWQETPVSKMIGMYKTLALAYPRALLLSLGLSHRSCMKVLVSLELIGSSLAPYAALEILDFYCYQVMTPEKEKLEVSIYFS